MYKIIGGDQKEYGPVTGEEIRRWIAEGRLNGQSLAQSEDSPGWRPLSSFAEFADALGRETSAAASSVIAPLPPAAPEVWAQQLLAGQPQLQIGHCLAASWQLLTQNFGLLFGATFLIWLISTVSQWVPFASFFFWILRGAFMGGLYLVFLRRIRGQPATVTDAFAGFNLAFVQLTLAGLVSGLLSVMAMCCFVIPGLYLWVAWSLSVPLVADRRLEFWPAMELSRKVVTRVWFEMFALMLIAFLPSILMYLFVEAKIVVSTMSVMRDMGNSPDFARMFSLGVRLAKANLPLLLLWKFVLLLNLPFALGALMYAYESLFGTRTAPAT